MRNIMKRRIARENAFIAAFEASFNANSIEEIVAASREQDEYAEMRMAKRCWQTFTHTAPKWTI